MSQDCRFVQVRERHSFLCTRDNLYLNVSKMAQIDDDGEDRLLELCKVHVSSSCSLF